jgi:hypothetical protein
MPLVSFNPDDLEKGFFSDINKYNADNNPSVNLVQEPLIKTFTEKAEIIDCINKIVSKFNEICETLNQENNEIPPTINNIIFEYSHDIHLVKSMNKNMSETLWMLRHKLCFQLLIVVYNLISNNALFNQFYSDGKRTFNETITSDVINNFKLGIWGSIKVTSDIDIGFQLADTKRTPDAISYVVSIFEDVFIILTEQNSLRFDIEPYADLMYLDTESDSLFYCDTTDFTIDDMINLMPTLGAGIIRNYVQSSIDSDLIKDVRRYTTSEKMAASEISKLIEEFNFNDKFDELNILASNLPDVKVLLENTSWITGAKAIANDYLTKPYNESRELYYKFVSIAENILAKNINALLNDAISDKKIRLDLIIAISTALNYRAESYISPSTVMHIVRVSQAGEKLEKPCAELPYPKPKAQCSLGNVGYLTSILEQAGYLMRFRLTYCENPTKKEKCDAKIGKYLPRILSGLDKLELPDATTNIKSQLENLYNINDTFKRGGNKQKTKKHKRHRRKSKTNKRRRLRKTKNH